MVPLEPPRTWMAIVWTVLVLFAQGALDPYLRDSQAPGLVVLFVLFLALRFDTLHSVLAGFLMGLIRDVATVSPFGLNTTILLLTGYLPHLLRRDLNLSSATTRIGFIVVATTAEALLRMAIHRVLGLESSRPWEGLGWRIALNLALAWPLFAAWERSLSRLPTESHRRVIG